MSTDLYT